MSANRFGRTGCGFDYPWRMIETRIASTRLATRRLRRLTLDPQAHPRAQPHLSAASGLVCVNGRAYVISDDEHHLAVFRDVACAGELHRLLPGDLPHGKSARKRLKPDFETLFEMPASPDWPASPATGAATLIALGSGSRPNRNIGVVVALDVAGSVGRDIPAFDLRPLYEPLRKTLGSINIEGAMVLGDEFVLLNRSVGGRSDNAVARYRRVDLAKVIAGRRAAVKPASIRRFALGALDGVPLGFTDAAALPGGGWVFSAVAEDTTDSVADGRCVGSVLGVVAPHAGVVTLRRLATPDKVEGIALRVAGRHIDICMVTDADDPTRASSLRLARL